jgi:hypothetical protein
VAKHRAPAPRLRARLALVAVVAIAAIVPTVAGSAAPAAPISNATLSVNVNVPIADGHYWSS